MEVEMDVFASACETPLPDSSEDDSVVSSFVPYDEDNFTNDEVVFSDDDSAGEETPFLTISDRAPEMAKINPKREVVGEGSFVAHVPVQSLAGDITRDVLADEESRLNLPRRFYRDVHLRLAFYAAWVTFFTVQLPEDLYVFLLNRHLRYLLQIDASFVTYLRRWLMTWWTIADISRLVALLLFIELSTGAVHEVFVLVYYGCYYLYRWFHPRGLALIICFIALINSPYVREIFFYLLRKGLHACIRTSHSGGVVSELTKKLKSKLAKIHSADRPSPTHPLSSMLRNDSLDRIETICKSFALDPYFLLMTRRLLVRNEDGSRRYRGAPTLHQTALDHINDPYAFHVSADEFGKDSAIVLIDRDYYIDMNEVFMLGLPVILFTFDPIIPCYRNDELEFTFDRDGSVIGKVNGGKDWNHKIWDYPDDMLSVCQRSVINVYKVLRYRCDNMRSIIIFYPIGSSFALTTKKLECSSPVHGGSLVMTRGPHTSVSLVGSHEYKTLPSTVWEALVGNIQSRSTITSVPSVTLYDVEMILSQHEFGGDDTLPAFIWNVLKALDYSRIAITLGTGKSDFLLPTVPLQDRVVGFAHIDDEGNGASERDSTGMKVIANPIIQGGGAEERTLQNTATAIVERCIKPQERADSLTEVIPEDLYKFSDEFADLCLKNAVLQPYDEEEVAKRMDKPGQKADREEAGTQSIERKTKVQQFQKVEHYAQPNDPRNITSEKGLIKEQFARYTYPVADMLKRQPWYAFGRSCPDVANRVAAICKFAAAHGLHIAETDYNRFDGNVSAFACWVEAQLFRRAYPGDDFIREIIEERHNRWVLTSDFIRYLSAYSLLSGRMDTSIFGTYFNAYIGYSALRREGLTPLEAWERLGMYGGDDGLAAVSGTSHLEQVALDVGMNLDARIVERPALRSNRLIERKDYVTFLARIYSPKVWEGDVDSCCDLARSLPKFGLTEANVPHKATRLWEKAYAASLNDGITPLIGVYTQTIVRIGEHVMGKVPLEASSLEEFYSKYDRTVNHWGAMACVGKGFPNFNHDGWMLTYVRLTFPEMDIEAVEDSLRQHCYSVAASALSVTVDRTLGKRNLKKALATALAPLQTIPTFYEIPLKVKSGAHVLVTTPDDAYLIVDESAPNRTPVPQEKFAPEVREGMVEAYTECHDVKSGTVPPAFPSMQMGARKCMFVAIHFIESILTVYKPRDLGGCQIVYTGAFSEMTAVPIAKYFNAKVPNAFRFHFVDPAFAGCDAPWIAELRGLPKVSVRTKHYDNNMMEKVWQDACKDGKERKVFWLDDAYSDKGQDPNGTYMKMKVATLNIFMSRFTLSCIKFRPTEVAQVLMCPRHNVNVYHTPRNSQFFSDVTEHRMVVGRYKGEEECAVAHKEKCREIDEAIALRALRLAEQIVESWVVPDKQSERKDGGDKRDGKRKEQRSWSKTVSMAKEVKSASKEPSGT